ncbi:MAG: response regulator [Myxococcota bacterium]
MALDRARLFQTLDALKTSRELLGDDPSHDLSGLSALQRIARQLRDHAASNGMSDLAELADEVQIAVPERLESSIELLLNEIRRELFRPVPSDGGVLVVSERPFERSQLAQLLSPLTDRVVESDGPGAAWSVLQRESVAAVVLDLPDVSDEGRVLLARIQSDPTLARMPVVVVSGRHTPQLRGEVLALGAWEFFTRPLPDRRLLAALATLMGLDDRMMLELDSDPRSGLPTVQSLKKVARRLQHEAEVSRRTYCVVLARILNVEALHRSHGDAAVAKLVRGVSDAFTQRLAAIPRTMESPAAAFSFQPDVLALLMPGCDAVTATGHLQAVLDQLAKVRLPAGSRDSITPVVAVGGVEILGMSFDRSIASAQRMLDLAEHAGAQAPVITPLSVAAPPRHRVLVVEDDHTVGDIVVRTLERAGLDAVLREDGLTALAIAQDMRFDLIISDIVMPFMDGLRLVENLREIPRYKRTPILFLTSLTSERHEIQGYEMGADAYITKPFNPRILAARVKSLLARNAG